MATRLICTTNYISFECPGNKLPSLEREKIREDLQFPSLIASTRDTLKTTLNFLGVLESVGT